jgi:hypothetical protein
VRKLGSDPTCTTSGGFDSTTATPIGAVGQTNLCGTAAGVFQCKYTLSNGILKSDPGTNEPASGVCTSFLSGFDAKTNAAVTGSPVTYTYKFNYAVNSGISAVYIKAGTGYCSVSTLSASFSVRPPPVLILLFF